MKIFCSYTEMVSLEKLVPNPRNDNQHKEEHAKLLAKVITARGIRHPIIVSKRSGFIAAGHLRLWAAKILNLESFPVDYQDFESEADEYAFLTSDNNVSRYAELDKNKMLDNLSELDLDLGDLDFQEFGFLDFTFDNLGEVEDKDDDKKDENGNKFRLEVQFANDMEMMDIHDDLMNRGYIVRVL